jgi:hypothetical protein
MPMPTRGAVDGAPSTTARIRVATEAPTCHASDTPSMGARPRCWMVPPSPIRATEIRSTPRSTAMT